MIHRLKEKLRNWLLESLRPGRNEDELLTLIKRTEAIQSDEQRNMLARMIEFHQTRIREIMIPRSAIKTVDIAMSLAEVENIMSASGVTRLPVTDGDLDKILGVVHVWDLFTARVENKPSSLQDMLRPCLKVSELQRTSGVLSDMREGSHIAIVLDEYGGTAGIVTLSDLLEEIIGEIDEDGEAAEEAEYVRTDSGSLEVQARMHVDELAELLETEFPEGDFDTVAGLITTELGRIPVRGERIKVAGLDIHIQEADPRRIIQILIKPTQASDL